jgi:Domain of unknown function (DUF1929)/Divergent InlB B-repeat domain
MRDINSVVRVAFHGWARLGGFTKIFLCILVLIVGALSSSGAFSGSVRSLLDVFKLEKDHKAPVDYGYGPGAPVGAPRPNLRLGQTPVIPKSVLRTPANLVKAGAVPKAGAIPISGGKGGFFGPPNPWPIIPIHMALLPDGRVITYGTDQNGAQGAAFIYEIWDPTLGNGANSHTLLPNGTATSIFCSASSLVGTGAGTSQLFIMGGDATRNGVANTGINAVTVFNPWNTSLTASSPMAYARWYPSITTLPNGDKFVMGGVNEALVPTVTPEVFNITTGWRQLQGINITDWFYPRNFLGPDDAVYLLQDNGQITRLTTAGSGGQTDTGARVAAGNFVYPTVMGQPFKVLAVRNAMQVQLVDVSSNPPVVTNVPSLGKDRIWANATLLADGRVLVTGGSGVYNEFTDVDYQAQLFDWTTRTWAGDASAAIPRLYHSSTLLLPDGSVVTAGGGAPGPVNELNAEIYYPSYLYLNNGSGNPAPRPTIVSAPSTLNLNQNFSLTVGANDKVGGINLIRVGSNTHSFNSEQRLIPLPFSQRGPNITATLNASPEMVPPGYYMLFVFNTAGTPSVAKIVPVPQSLQSLPDLIVSYSSATVASGTQGGPFSPSSFSYTLSATSGSVNYSITNVPNWLTASSTSGAVTTTAKSITFKIDSRADKLPPGTSITSINFNNTTNDAGNTAITAMLTVNPKQFTITVSASPKADGTVSGGGTFAEGSSNTVTATPNSGFVFVRWTEGGKVVSTSESYTFTLGAKNVTLVADFR